jgi:A/G-specific adenine glycosylase
VNVPKEIKREFHKKLLKWYKKNKRNFHWRYNKEPYKVLISEVLLQKTNAPKVEPVYNKLIRKYPTPESLQRAKITDVKKIMKDLGLLYRAERLISIGKTLTANYKGAVPSKREQLLGLRGLGKYAASAVMCFAFNKCESIVDNNVVRLFERIFGFKSTKKRPREDTALWHFAKSILPSKNVRDYNYALLDFSALVLWFINMLTYFYTMQRADIVRPTAFLFLP